MADRNTIVGIDFLTVGLVISALGYILDQSVPIAAFGFSLAVIGALLLLIVPEPIPQDAFRALLKDAIGNVELILEESQLRARAYFVQLEDRQIRAFVPIMSNGIELATTEPSGGALIQNLNRAPRRFITSFAGLQGVLLIPPGNEIVLLSKIQTGDELEGALSSALVSFSDLARSVVSLEEGHKIIIQISSPKIKSNSTFFNECLGSPLSCIAACAAAVVKGIPVKLIDEKFDGGLIRLTLETAK